MRRKAAFLAASLLGAVAGAGPASAGSVWSTYHANQSRTGVDSSEPSFANLKPAWSSGLDGAAVYGQSVVAAGRVFVATEDDDVYALDAHDGHVLWHRNIGRPLTNVSSQVGCGDIDPLGITSTPVIDSARHTVFVVGESSNGGALPVHHRLVGFNIYTGSVVREADADPSTADNLKYLQQRAALALANGRVYVAYGGLAGDCGSYHGWVVGVDEAGTRADVQFNATPSGSGGAIWNGGGGPSIDGLGNVYAVTGNPNSGSEIPWADDVVKLGPNLGSTPLAAFHDSATSATNDQDLGTSDAVLLPGGEVFTAGKTDIGYLLYQSNLHQVHSISGSVCGSDPDGGSAFDSTTDSVYLPCMSGGIQQVNLHTFSTGWRSGSANGAPILVDGNLWAAEYNSGTLEELNPANGAVLQTVGLPGSRGGVPNFASPSSADGLLLVGANSGVVAFDGPSGPPPPAPPPPAPTAGYWLAASDGGVFSFGTAGFHGSLGGVHLKAPIVAMAATPTGRGYWLVASDGGVFAFGDAHFFGSTGGVHLARPVVGMAVAPGGDGYWLVASDGGVFTFGPGARFFGSTGGVRLRQPVVGIAAAGAGKGYWLVARDGGVFAFHATFYGSTGGVRLTQPIVGIAGAGAGKGYWLVARDGGVFAFVAPFRGSTGGVALVAPIVGMAPDTRTGGYWLVASDGGIFSFGAPFEGSTGGVALVKPIVAMAPA